MNSSTNAPKMIDHAYVPGYVDEGYISLTVFLPSRLDGAVKMLQKHQFAKAEPAFAQEMKAHPGDLAAVLGYLQSIPGRWDALMPEYRREAQAHPHSVTALFKLGVLASYIFGERGYPTSDDAPPEAHKLLKYRWKSLETAYKIGHDPVVGFTIACTAFMSALGGYPKIYEDILRRMGGPTIWRVYDHAKKAGWRGEQPTIPQLAVKQLHIFRLAVGEIWKLYSCRTFTATDRHLINGVWHITWKENPMPPLQKRAFNYLSKWRDRLNEAIKAKERAVKR